MSDGNAHQPHLWVLERSFQKEPLLSISMCALVETNPRQMAAVGGGHGVLSGRVQTGSWGTPGHSTPAVACLWAVNRPFLSPSPTVAVVHVEEARGTVNPGAHLGLFLEHRKAGLAALGARRRGRREIQGQQEGSWQPEGTSTVAPATAAWDEICVSRIQGPQLLGNAGYRHCRSI